MVEYEDKLYFLNPYIVSIDSNLHFCDNYIPLSVFYYAFGDKESERLAFQGIENSIQSIFVVKNKYLLLQIDEMIKFMNIETYDYVSSIYLTFSILRVENIMLLVTWI